MSRRCARPGCGRVASATLSFSYGDQAVWIDELHPIGHPASHDLCRGHADRTSAPRGWELKDSRPGWAGADPGVQPDHEPGSSAELRRTG